MGNSIHASFYDGFYRCARLGFECVVWPLWDRFLIVVDLGLHLRCVLRPAHNLTSTWVLMVLEWFQNVTSTLELYCWWSLFFFNCDLLWHHQFSVHILDKFFDQSILLETVERMGLQFSEFYTQLTFNGPKTWHTSGSLHYIGSCMAIWAYSLICFNLLNIKHIYSYGSTTQPTIFIIREVFWTSDNLSSFHEVNFPVSFGFFSLGFQDIAASLWK